ncbi:MAG TPA: class I SAM-dependent methyltransferase [Vicinamibacterales bacterium]|nr:class I SAM-dependent methyltransferase [Vicinamibacterales bacterium]
MSERVDFSANASVYDRRHGAIMSDDEMGRLWMAAGPQVGARVLDIGAGTGRMAIPLASRSCNVVAVEPAGGMLAQLRAKTGDNKVWSVVAEGARLPFPVGLFDAVVIARLLYLTPDWRAILRDAHRVLAIGGCLLHEWGNGQVDQEWVQIREEGRRLCEQVGLRAPFHPGVRSETDVDCELDDLGLVREGQLEMGPGPPITLREFLRRPVDGELSYIWAVPEQVRAECLPPLQRWSEHMFDLDRPVPIPRELRWTIRWKRASDPDERQ